MARTKLTLQDVARTAADKNGGKGGRSLQRIAEKKGLTLSFTTVDRILAGKYESTPQKQTIEALAVLAEMPLEDVYEAAGLPLPMASFAEQLPEGVDYLTVHQRRVVLDVIRGFIRDNRRIDDLEDELSLTPLHPHQILERAEGTDVRALADEDLDWLFEKIVLVEHGNEEGLQKVREFSRALEDEMRRRVRSGGRAVEDPAQRDGVIRGERRRSLTRDDFDRAADDSGPSLLEADDARAARRGEESQDPGHDEPA